MGNSNLLGAASKQFVQKQIKIRQENLSQKDNPYSTLTSQQIVQQNANTSYVALASSVNIENTPESKNYVSNTLIFPMPQSTQVDLAAQNAQDTTGNVSNNTSRSTVNATEALIADTDAKLEAARNLPALDPTTAKDFAQRLDLAVKGVGTDEDVIYNIYTLIATEPRLAQVKEVYKSLENKTYETLDEAIVKELSQKDINNNLYLYSEEELTPNQPIEFPPSIEDVDENGDEIIIDELPTPSVISGATFEELNPPTTVLNTIPEGTEGTERIQSLELGGTPSTYFGNALARNLVLSNGTSEINSDGSRSQKFGVLGNEYNSEDIFEGNNNYGFGNDKDWGLVAMPGLEGVDIKSKNMGSLREATVNIRANSESQFKLLDTIYNRIGYTMFLEWGHGVFFNSKGEYVSNPIENGVESLIPRFLEAKDDLCVTAQGNLQRAIQENKEISGGNYDAFLGLVTNFTWEFNEGGYYTIILKMSSIGDVIESLQIDQPLSNTSNPYSAPQESIQETESSALAKFLTVAATPNGSGVFLGDRWSIFGKSFGKEIIKNNYEGFKKTLVANNTFSFKTEDLVTTMLKNLAALPALFVDGVVAINFVAADVVSLGQTNISNIRPSTTNLTELIFNDDSTAITTKTLSSIAGDYSLDLMYERPSLHPGLIISARAIFGNTPYSYVRFGDILDFIKGRLLIYNSLCDNEPIIDINTELDANFCYYSGVNMSADPSKIMVSVDLPITKEYLQGFANIKPKQKPSSNDPVKQNWEHRINTNSIFKGEFTKLENFVTNAAFVGKKSGLTAGLIMNMYFEYDYLLDAMRSNRDSDTNMLTLFDFIQDLLDTANSCLGGVNKLAMRIEDDSTLRIYDQNMIYGGNPEEEKEEIEPIINLYGLKSSKNANSKFTEGSFVKNFNIQTNLSNAFATQITIGAQAQGSTGTMDSDVLSFFNSGLIDRVKPKVFTSSEKTTSKSKSQTNYENLIKTRDKLMYLWLGYAEGFSGQFSGPLSETAVKNLIDRGISDTQVKTNDVESLFNGVQEIEESKILYFKNFPEKSIGQFVKLQKDFLSLLHINSDYISNQQGMLPLSINVTLEGLSGIRIYDKLRVDTRMIPNYYPQVLEWIIKGVSHSIQNNQWITSLETIAVPKLPNIPEGKSPLASTKYKSYDLIPLEGINPTPSPPPFDNDGAIQELGLGSSSDVNGKLDVSNLLLVATNPDMYLAKTPGEDFLRMAAAAASSGSLLPLNDAYRDIDNQQSIFDWDLYVATGGSRLDTSKNSNAKRKKRGSNGSVAVAFPGTSNHGLGKAIDVNGAKAQNWIKKNGFHYGWSWYEGKRNNENWHFTWTTREDQLQDLT